MKKLYNNKYKKFLSCYNSIIIFISFKLNNIFISINRFIKFMEFFILNTLLKSYSCGIENLKNKNKTSLKAYNIISNKVKIFLLSNKIKKFHIIFKSSKRLKYIFLNILLNILCSQKHLIILSIYLNLSIPFNGCKLQKRKFL